MFTNRKPGKSPWPKAAKKMDLFFNKNYALQTMHEVPFHYCWQVQTVVTRKCFGGWVSEEGGVGRRLHRQAAAELARGKDPVAHSLCSPLSLGSSPAHPQPLNLPPHSQGSLGILMGHNGKVNTHEHLHPKPSHKNPKRVLTPNPKGFHSLALAFQKEDHCLQSPITDKLYLRKHAP